MTQTPETDVLTPPPASAGDLALFAFDGDDLEVISTNMQDALIARDDLVYIADQKRFVLAADRFDWVAAGQGSFQRIVAGLHFEHVTKVERRGFAPMKPQTAPGGSKMNLLSIHFTSADAPAGQVELTFSGHMAVRLHVECLEASLRDIGPRSGTQAAPLHPLDIAPGNPR